MQDNSNILKLTHAFTKNAEHGQQRSCLSNKTVFLFHKLYISVDISVDIKQKRQQPSAVL